MKPLKNVYYFCKVTFKEHPKLKKWFNEIECVRMYEDDLRVNQYEKDYYKKGHIIKIRYLSSLSLTPEYEDLDWEKEQIWNNYRWSYSKYKDILTIKNIEKDEMK